MKLKGMRAVVTGGSTGIGREIARAIAAEGGRVALVARSRKGLKETQKLILDSGGEATIFVTDLRDEQAINKLAADVKKEWGGADIVANVAGVWHDEESPYTDHRLWETPPEQINEVLDVGIRAPMLLTRLFLAEMIRKKRGKVLNVSGSFFSGATGWLHYYVSKKALESFTIGLAEELQEHQIQVNCISPSDTATEAYRKYLKDYAEWVDKHGLRPEDVAKFAVLLLSEDADHITGQTIILRSKADTERYVLAQ